MRTRHAPRNRRRVLCISPRYVASFGTFHHAYPLFGGRIRAFMPPQGLLVVAAYLPESWEVRFIDENAAPATAGSLCTSALLMSGLERDDRVTIVGRRLSKAPSEGKLLPH